MDNNLSITIDAKKVVEILKERTHSGIPRLDRIKENNPELFEKLGAPDKVTEKLSEDLIDWSNELNVTISSDIENAKIELNVYIKLIELLTTSIDDVEATAVLLKNFTKMIRTQQCNLRKLRQGNLVRIIILHILNYHIDVFRLICYRLTV